MHFYLMQKFFEEYICHCCIFVFQTGKMKEEIKKVLLEKAENQEIIETHLRNP